MSKDTPLKAMNTDLPTCGIVMPISTIDGCSEEHWKDVMSILSDAVRSAEYEPNLVSNDTDIGVIHKRIVQNLYNNPVVVCDVSGKNPNVMFELGMRLAFDKPVIIVKDDKTPYSFDTSPVEHLTYPRDLRFGAIVDFKIRLTEKIKSSTTNRNSFLSSFGTFKVAKIEEESAGAFEILMDEMASLKVTMARIEDRSRFARSFAPIISREDVRRVTAIPRGILPDNDEKLGVSTFVLTGPEEARAKFSGAIKANNNFLEVRRLPFGLNSEHFTVFSKRELRDNEIAGPILTTAERYDLRIQELSLHPDN